MPHTQPCSEAKPCLSCKLGYWRENGLQVAPSATPSRHNQKPPAPNVQNAWERGVPTDSRGMPLLKGDLTPMGQKEFSQRRHAIEEGKKTLHTAPPTPNP